MGREWRRSSRILGYLRTRRILSWPCNGIGIPPLCSSSIEDQPGLVCNIQRNLPLFETHISHMHMFRYVSLFTVTFCSRFEIAELLEIHHFTHPPYLRLILLVASWKSSVGLTICQAKVPIQCAGNEMLCEYPNLRIIYIQIHINAHRIKYSQMIS